MSIMPGRWLCRVTLALFSFCIVSAFAYDISVDPDSAHARNQTSGLPTSVWNLNDWIAGTPVVGADARVYVGTRAGALYALSFDNSTVELFRVPSWVDGATAIGPDGHVYAGADDGVVRSVASTANNSGAWHPGSPVRNTPIFNESGSFFVQTVDGRIFKGNPDGTLNVISIENNAAYSQPTIGANSIVYAGNADGIFYAFNPDNSILWKTTCDGAIVAAATIAADGKIIFGTTTGNVYALNPDGTMAQQWRLGGSVNAPASIMRNGVILVTCMDGKVYALSPSGHIRRTWDVPCVAHSSPVVADNGAIYVGPGLNGMFYSLLANGGVSATWKLANHIDFINDFIGFEGELNEQIWTSKKYADMADPVILPDGRILVAMPTGKIYALQDNAQAINVQTVLNDYTGSGISDIPVFDQTSGYWFILGSDTKTIVAWNMPWGWAGAAPVPGDYNGDGKSDFAVFDQNTGAWFVLDADGVTVLAWNVQWGWPGAAPVPGDYNGDGKSDFAVFDQNTGSWFVLDAGGMIVLAWDVQWGWPGAAPVGKAK